MWPPGRSLPMPVLAQSATNFFKYLSSLAPSYLLELVLPHFNTRIPKSSKQLLLALPQTRLSTCGGSAFLLATTKLWNSLPLQVRTAAKQVKSLLLSLGPARHILMLTELFLLYHFFFSCILLSCNIALRWVWIWFWFQSCMIMFSFYFNCTAPCSADVV